MSRKASRFNLPIITLAIFFLVATVAYPINGMESRKLDESTVPGDQGAKCTPSCLLTPPPPPPSPPPPRHKPKKPPPPYCPPSPPSFIYITGPPGNLYPIDENFGGASRNLEVGLLALVSGFLVLLAL